MKNINKNHSNMETNFERKGFLRKFIIMSTAFIAVGIFMKTLFSEKLYVHDYVMFAIFIIGYIALGVVLYMHVNKLYKGIEVASEIMIDVVEKSAYEEELYEQGSLGIMYTNMYKMINTLNESKLKEQNEKIFLRDIIQDISHQLKTPLASLNVFVDLLLDDTFEDAEKKRKMLEESKNQLNRMEWLVLAMLRLARLEAGAVTFDCEQRQVKQLLSESTHNVNYLISKRNQRVTIDCDENITLNCDGEWLTEAIVNILKNASDYSSENSEIKLYAEKTDVYVRIYIEDNGVGIADSDVHNIFKRFYRVNHEVNPNSIGIGLPLAKSIVEGMGGKITLRSELGMGTVFMLTFVTVY